MSGIHERGTAMAELWIHLDRNRPWKGSIVYTYCLFCETVKCHSVAEEITERLHCRAISPKLVQHTWSRGKAVDIVHDLLPGYVFVYAEEAPLDVAFLRSIGGVIRCLCDGNKRFELSGSDEQFALMILEKNGVIGKTKVYREGQMIRVCQGAYAGLETKILKVNPRNMRMQIEIPFANMYIRTWVEYEVVSDREGD